VGHLRHLTDGVVQLVLQFIFAAGHKTFLYLFPDLFLECPSHKGRLPPHGGDLFSKRTLYTSEVIASQHHIFSASACRPGSIDSFRTITMLLRISGSVSLFRYVLQHSDCANVVRCRWSPDRQYGEPGKRLESAPILLPSGNLQNQRVIRAPVVLSPNPIPA